MTGTETLFDLAGLAHKPGRYGAPVLQCPGCQRWCAALLIGGDGVFRCLPCERAKQGGTGWKRRQGDRSR